MPHASSEKARENINALLDRAFDAYERGQREQARQAFQAVLMLDAHEFDALNMLGVLTMQSRDWAGAIDLFERAIAVAPDEGMAHTNLGLACMEAGQPVKALASLDKAIVLEPSAEAFYGRGLAQQALQRWDVAVNSFARVTALQPHHAEAHFHQGVAMQYLQRHAEALARLEQALALQPRHVAALIHKGLSLINLQRPEEALAAYEQALAIDGMRAGAHKGRGDACLALGRFQTALEAYGRSLALKADQADVLCNRAIALQRLGRHDEAIAGYERAVAIAPDHAVALSNLSGALRDVHRNEEALSYADRALAIDAKLAGAHLNRGNALLDMVRLPQAIDAFSTAAALQPDNIDLQWALGWASLLAGDWARGLPLFEARWLKPGFSSQPRHFTQPLWLGDEPLQNRTVLLHGEQGLGDTLQFCRYAPLVAALGAKVILEVQPPLRHLMASLAGPAQVIAQGEPLPPFDLHCPLMSLPLAFRTTPDDVPARASYLRAAPGLVEALASRLGPRTRPRIGLAWSGNAAHRNNINRSVPLASLMSALPAGADYFCLQRDILDTDRPALAGQFDLRIVPEVYQSFDQTAALVEAMDLVISIDTSLAHLAGALGKPCWILLSRAPDWRWLTDREDCPWYPCARLFRQQAWGPWDATLLTLRQALTAWLPDTAM